MTWSEAALTLRFCLESGLIFTGLTVEWVSQRNDFEWLFGSG